MSRYQKVLLLAFALVWLWSAYRPKFPHDWLLENILVVVFVPAIIFLGRYLKLSDLSYTLITIFMILHVIGSHYTYSEVPFGFTLQKWMGSSRNMYDRIVHFCFGFLLAYPVREVFMRVARAKGFWGFYLPLDVTLSFSALYEVIEWVVAANVDPAAGAAYLGTQGDIWDAQKDMLLAGSGAALAMLIIAAINWRYNPTFGAELKESFAIPRNDKPLGEELLERWRRRRARA